MFETVISDQLSFYLKSEGLLSNRQYESRLSPTNSDLLGFVSHSLSAVFHNQGKETPCLATHIKAFNGV